MKTIIIRHRRENLRKCSLTGLENKPELSFHTYPKDAWPTLVHPQNYLLLKVGAPPLSQQDKGKGLFLIDGTWRLSEVIERQMPYTLETRSLPEGFTTAYPRRQTDCVSPEQGLASVEALYLAHLMLGLPTEGLLNHYRWKETFLTMNRSRFRFLELF